MKLNLTLVFDSGAEVTVSGDGLAADDVQGLFDALAGAAEREVEEEYEFEEE